MVSGLLFTVTSRRPIKIGFCDGACSGSITFFHGSRSKYVILYWIVTWHLHIPGSAIKKHARDSTPRHWHILWSYYRSGIQAHDSWAKHPTTLTAWELSIRHIHIHQHIFISSNAALLILSCLLSYISKILKTSLKDQERFSWIFASVADNTPTMFICQHFF